MTLASDDRYTRHDPVVSTDTFLVGFPIFATADIEVYVDGVKDETFSVTATFTNGRSTDASITLTAAVIDVPVEIYGARAPRRDDDFASNSPDLAKNLQIDMDRIVATQQEQARDLPQFMRLPISIDPDVVSTILPVPEAGKTLVWKAGEDGLENGLSASEMSTYVADSAASAASAAGSATAAGDSATAAEAAAASVAATYATISALDAETDIIAGQRVVVASGYNGEPETFEIVAALTYTANSQEVYDLSGSSLQAVSLRTSFKTVTELLADTREAGFFAADPSSSVDAQFEAQGFRYDQALSGALDEHLTTAGGVKLYVKPIFAGATGGLYAAQAFNAKADGTDDHAAIQAALNAAGVFTNPATNDDIFPGLNHNIGQGTVVLFAGGTHTITDELDIPPGVMLDMNGAMLKQTSAAKSAIVMDYSATSGGGYGLYAASVINGFIVGPGRGTSTARGIFGSVLNRSQVRNVNIAGFAFGVTLWESQYNTLDDVRITACDVGLYLTARPADTTLTCIDNNFNNVSVSFCKYGVWAQVASHCLFSRLDASRNEVVDVLVGSQLVGYISDYTVTAAGSGYGASTTVPVTISGGGGSMAQAYAITNASGEITDVVGVDGGDGYTSAPTVTIGGSGSGATATATVADDTGLGDWDGTSAIVRGHNIFLGLKVEHSKDDIPTSGYAVIINDTTCRRNIFEHPAMTRQPSGSGPTEYTRLMRTKGFGTIVSCPQDTQNSSFSTITNPADSSDFSVFRSVASQGLNIVWSGYNDGEDVMKFVINSSGSTVESGAVAQQSVNDQGYHQAVGYVACNSVNSAKAFRTQKFSEASERFNLLTDGKMRWGSGSASTDIELYRSGASVLALGSDDCFTTGQAATGSRPSASAVGAGAQFYDTTLGKPIWSDGSAWRDAAGTVV